MNARRNIRYGRAKGTLSPDGKSKAIAIHFEVEIFERIATEAIDNERTFGEQVRVYIGRGIDAVEGKR